MSPNSTKVTDLASYLYETEAERKRVTAGKGAIIGDIPLDRTFGGEILRVYSVDRSNYTHGFHKFPAKYIPEIPRWAIQKYSKESDVILDPFCGSGTTNVEARLHGRHSYAIDVDPIALLLTKVKTTPLEEAELKRERGCLFRNLYELRETEIPDFPNREYWFKPKVLRDLGTITHAINLTKNEDMRDFFKVCLSSILKEVSNADPKFLYALAISRKMRQQKHRVIDAKSTFMERVNELIPKMLEYSKACEKNHFIKIIGKDARNIALENESVDLAITSPPYLNAVDYPRAHQLQIYWFGLWKGKLSELKKYYIGTEQVSAGEYSTLKTYGNRALDEIQEKIYKVDRKRSYVVHKYFTDMRQNFFEVKRVLKPSGHYVVAVADNVIRKIPVSTHSILMDIAEEVGFKVLDYYGSQLMMRPHNMRNAEKMSVEWVMTFRKEG